MEREDLIAHLTAWTDGVDPATGAPLPSDHPAQRADTLRVLLAAVGALRTAPSARRDAATDSSPPAPRPAQAGRAWSPAEDQLLGQAWDAGARVGELARAHERTRGAITARLVKLGRIDPPPGLRLRGEAPLATGRA
jgi:hypothetical protein